MYTHIYILLSIYTVANLTIKVLFALTFMLKDHKTKPVSDKLMTVTPVRNTDDQ